MVPLSGEDFSNVLLRRNKTKGLLDFRVTKVPDRGIWEAIEMAASI